MGSPLGREAGDEEVNGKYCGIGPENADSDDRSIEYAGGALRRANALVESRRHEQERNGRQDREHTTHPPVPGCDEAAPGAEPAIQLQETGDDRERGHQQEEHGDPAIPQQQRQDAGEHRNAALGDQECPNPATPEPHPGENREQHTARHGEDAEGDQPEAGRVVCNKSDDQPEYRGGNRPDDRHRPVRRALRGIVLQSGHATSLPDDDFPVNIAR